MTPVPAVEDARPPALARLGGRSGLALTLFVLGLAGVLLALGWREALAIVRRVEAWQLALLCLMALAHYAIRAARWHALVGAAGVASDLGRDLRHFFGGFAMIATPGRVGELVRLRWLRRETGWPLVRLLPVAFADRAVELAALLLPIGAALSAASLGASAVWWLMAVSVALVALACRPDLLEAALVGTWRLAGRRGARGFATGRRMVRGLRALLRPGVLVPILVLGAAGWAIEGAAFWLLLGWLGVPLPFAEAAAIFLIAVLAGAVSGLPGGLGGTEATAIALLALQDVPLESAVVAVALIRLATLWFAILIGLAIFPLAEARAHAAQRLRDDKERSHAG
jgi:uncharacterized membrane protein YbhN (UPF0104 family)